MTQTPLKTTDANSYVSASAFPYKLLSSQVIDDGKIIPVHIQLVPTNRCNAKCSWCSCRGVDRSKELSIEEIKEILSYFAFLGTKAVTITGGGEPTIHPDIIEVLKEANRLGIETGLVTNGLFWQNKDLAIENELLTWARFSVIDTVGKYNCNIINNLCQKLNKPDLGITYTVTKDANIHTAIELCKIIDNYENVTHIRFVQEIININNESSQKLEEIKNYCDKITSKGIYQRRDDYIVGSKKCLISLLKPLIDATGYIFPCCGVQYADDEIGYMPEKFRMCYWNEFHKTSYFDGSICKKCYYNEYNKCLNMMTSECKHKNFL